MAIAGRTSRAVGVNGDIPMLRLALAALPALMLADAAVAAPIPTQIGTNGEEGTDYFGSTDLLHDGVYPADGTFYQTNTVYGFGTTTYFDFIFRAARSVGSFNVTVDNNDNYTLAFYNGANLLATRTILAAQGNVGGGVETFSSDPSLPGNYLSTLALTTPVTATFVRITASGGDGAYSIGEGEFFAPAASAAVPEMATWAMMIAGFGAVGFAMRRQVRRSDAKFDARIKRIAAGEVLS